MQIQRYLCVRVKYICLMSGKEITEYIRARPNWRRQGPRYDCAIINGSVQLEFVKILAYFKLPSATDSCEIALVCCFKYKGWHRHSGYIQLTVEDKTDIILVDTIIKSVHITSPSTYNLYFTVQDLQQPDVYLRLITLN